jgi:hypothetical protein
MIVSKKIKSLYNRTYRQKHRVKINKNANERRLAAKLEVYKILGNRCSNVSCKWANEDGSIGCTDIRCLQIDHKFGGGMVERRNNRCTITYYNNILKDTSNYQLLCANCNWIKRIDNGEWPPKSCGDDNGESH